VSPSPIHTAPALDLLLTQVPQKAQNVPADADMGLLSNFHPGTHWTGMSSNKFNKRSSLRAINMTTVFS